MTFVLRSADDERVDRTELSEIWTAALGEVEALGLSCADDFGEGELVAIADGVISGGAALGEGGTTAGVSDGCATLGLTEGSGVCVDSGDAATTAGVAFGITCGEGVSVGWTLGCGAGDSLGWGVGISVGSVLADLTTRGRCCLAARFSACGSTSAKVKLFRSPRTSAKTWIPVSSP